MLCAALCIYSGAFLMVLWVDISRVVLSYSVHLVV